MEKEYIIIVDYILGPPEHPDEQGRKRPTSEPYSVPK